MNYLLKPGKLKGTVQAISAKSVLHRQIICAMQAEQPTEIRFHGLSEDVKATLTCARALGCSVDVYADTIRIARGAGAVPTPPTLDCGESGSTARFMLPVAAAIRDGFTLVGSGRLPERPMDALCRTLEGHGCTCSGNRLPITVRGKLTGGAFALPGNVSSQYISGLLLASPQLDGCDIRIRGSLSSAGYVDITVQVLQQFGIHVQRTEDGFHVPGGQKLISPGLVEAEGDWSNAAFWLCAGELSSGGVVVTGLNADSTQGDRAVLAAIEAMRRPGTLEMDIDAIPDLLPVLSVLAAARRDKTVFSNAARLRLKESDRLDSTCALLTALGGRAETSPDSLTVFGGGLLGGQVDAWGDHRIVMSAAVASTICPQPVTICGAEAVNKSYPSFFSDFCALGGVVQIL